MKTSLSASIIFVLFMTALIVYMCHGGQSITGKYNVSVMPKSEANTDEEKAAIEFLKSVQIQYDFKDNGTLNAITSFGEISKDTLQSWSIVGDSIVIGTEHFKLEKMGDGYVFRGSNVDLVLEK